jgi:hypothetical protein
MIETFNASFLLQHMRLSLWSLRRMVNSFKNGWTSKSLSSLRTNIQCQKVWNLIYATQLFLMQLKMTHKRFLFSIQLNRLPFFGISCVQPRVGAKHFCLKNELVLCTLTSLFGSDNSTVLCREEHELSYWKRLVQRGLCKVKMGHCTWIQHIV